MKNYKMEIKSNVVTENYHTNSNSSCKIKNQLEKRDQLISFLTSILGNLKCRVNYKNENLDNLVNRLKTKNYDTISELLPLDDYLPPSKERLNSIGTNEILIKGKYKNLNYDIFKYLNSFDLINLGMTCKQMKEITENKEYWEKIYFKDFDLFLFLDDRDRCEIVEQAKEFYNKNKEEDSNKVNSTTGSEKIKTFDFQKKYIELRKINKRWESDRPVVTTISTTESVTCLHLDPKTNELIYSLADGSASLFRLYSYRKIAHDEELYMQHHKQTKICDRVSSFHGHGGSIWCLDRSDEILFTGSYDKTIKLWQTRSGECIYTIRAHDTWVSSIHYDPKFEMLISSSWDSTIKLWNIKTFRNTLTLNTEIGNYIYCVRSNLGEDEIISGNEFKNIEIFNINAKAPVLTLRGHSERINNLKFKNNFIFSGSEDKHARLWDKRTGKCEILFTGHMKGITQVEYDHLNSRVYTASNDKTIKIWDIRKNVELRTLVGHSDAVCSIAFDQTKLISGSRDNSIRIWNFLN